MRVPPDGAAESSRTRARGRDLARRVARQLVDDVDAARPLVAGQLARGGRRSVDSGVRGRRVDDDHGGDRLAPALVGHAEHGDVGDLGVGRSTCSTSAGYTFSPPLMIMSFSRPVT